MALEASMCGIVGYLNLEGQGGGPEVLASMVARLRHRGPDDAGTFHAPGVGLGHARLSIIDLAGGHQPMANQDRSLWITFNGEIFNYLELREELLAKGHRFETHSDTEVLLHLFQEEGEACVERLNGQWAFAVWDQRAGRLFLCRDRLGVRPLYYSHTSRALVFASEVKALLAWPGLRREIDPLGLDEIFTLWTTQPPRTIFRDICELPPGHSLVCDQRGLTVKRYWQLEYPCDFGDPGNEAEKAAELLDLLVDATRIRLRADVPVGAYLSGGLDSTLTTALIRKHTSAQLRTFSVTFEESAFDESAFQREAVGYLNTEHTEVRCTNREIGEIFPEVIRHTEKPILRTAPAPLYLLSRLVRQNGYKVVVTGEGSDEVLGGYDIFKEAKIRRFWGAHPDSRLRPLLLKRLYPYLQNLQNQSDAYRRAFFHVRPGDLASPFYSHLPRWELTTRLKSFFSADLKAALQGRDLLGELESGLPRQYFGWHSFCQAQYLESTGLLPGYILASQGDRVAMAHSVEGRFPFLDVRVVEYAARLHPSLKMKVLDEKHLLKACADGLVPQSIRNRPKQPYRAPEGQCFFPAGGLDYVEELLSPRRLDAVGLFDAAPVGILVEKVRRGRAIGIKDNMAFVGILSTQLVADAFLHGFERNA